MGKFNNLFWLDTKLFDIVGIAIGIKRFPYYLLNQSSLRDNARILEVKKSDKCFILGLGPSLKNVDLNQLDGDIIAVNSFYRLNNNSIRPNIYCIMDDLDYISDNSKTLNDATSMYPDSFFVLNGKYKKNAEQRIKGSISRAYLFAWGGYINPEKKIDICKVMPIMGNIICYAIYLALYMGYKKIVLLGCDFNSFTSRKPLYCFEDDNKKTLSLAYELFCYSFCADTHIQLYRYAKQHGVDIENATKGSLIDVYPFSDDIEKYYIL